MGKNQKQEALEYHAQGRPGKVEVVPTKPYSSQRDLSLAYSPGVADPCVAIHEQPEDVYKYTAKGNLVAVISNGTAVLGLGNIGPEASKPVMEGKGVLFKIFADIDVFDIEVNNTEVDAFVNTVKAIAPTFGGINLEDIKAPECFEIEKRLREELDIPVMHDDQHGTAIISAAALINALEIVGKDIRDVKIVVNGAGASAVSCTKLYLALGATLDHIVMVDSKGVITKEREGLDEQKSFFATDRKIETLEEAMKDADVFLGLSKGNVVTGDMVKSMAANPIVFALANPDPEISWPEAMAAREDIVMATGRSDYPNQVNNVLGFPFIFRGALDVRATTINEEMKLAAVQAIANLAKEPVPEIVNQAYNARNMVFGKDYIIPKPMDPRLITRVAPAVAKAALETGVAKHTIEDWEGYDVQLIKRMGLDNKLIAAITTQARQNPKRVVFAEADHYKILKAAKMAKDEGIAKPILLGNEERIRKLMKDNHLDLGDTPIIDPRSEKEEDRRRQYGDLLFHKRQRRGFTDYESRHIMRERNYFGAMMVENGEADALISGLTRNYPDTVRPALQIIGTQKDVKRVAGMYILFTKKGPLFFADTTVNTNPTADELVDIAVLTARAVKQFNVQPRIAMLSYSNFGSSDGSECRKVREATATLKEKFPGLIVDGEVQANFALNPDMLRENFPFTELGKEGANTLIFPNLSAGNIAYKLVLELGASEVIGPVLLGLNKSVHVLQLGSSVREIVNMITLAVVDAQNKKKTQ
ncbi:MAG: NADP-dependent malic enzyme [Flavobacteriales bacterium]|nr:NADP-dependent malic enzyme [Flavobacteriales bacterium]MCB9449246.1 NADP-dependent malic enzyme [Flavobacteriales bacterium]